ncbi:MAG TPA: ribose-phosphate pyrophosphokinase [Nitrososphaerales archaeon]|nr:ribose-phosphate pyrophosphokinase [Nitrososphaerales archaeon]
MVGPASQEFGTKLAKRLGLPLLAVTTTEFPDGEIKYKFEEDLNGLKVLLVQATYPPSGKHYMQLFLASHHMSQEGAKVHAVIPYLGYARQNKAFVPGEIVSLGIVAHLLRSVGVQRVTTVDMHSAEGLALFSMPIYSVSAIPGLAQYVKTQVKLEDPVIVAPDAGSLKRTEAFASLYGAKSIHFRKNRDKVTGRIKMEADRLNVKGRDCVIVDDVVTTGGTVAASTELLKSAGARKVVSACVHAVLVGETYEKLMKAGVDEIIGTNTVPSRVSKVDATEPMAAYLRTILAEK